MHIRKKFPIFYRKQLWFEFFTGISVLFFLYSVIQSLNLYALQFIVLFFLPVPFIEKAINLRFKGFLKYSVYFIFFTFLFLITYFISLFFVYGWHNVGIVKLSFYLYASVLFSVCYYIIRFIIFKLLNKPFLLFLFFFILSSLLFVFQQKNLVYSSLSFLIMLLLGILITIKQIKKDNSLAFATVILFVFLLGIGGYLGYMKASAVSVNQKSSLLTQEMFKFKFKDQLDISSDYGFQNQILFYIKSDNVQLLKSTVYSSYSFEKGFYRANGRELEFPLFLKDYYWENSDYIQGKDLREEDRITVFNINLSKDLVFGKNEVYKIIPMENYINSPFTNIFEGHSFILNDLYLKFLSFKNLSSKQYEYYTKIEIPDEDVLNFIRSKPENIKTPGEIATYYYHMFKTSYQYSLHTLGEGFDIIKNFLLTDKKGYCSHFAYSYAMILRYYGIPCRIAAGFKPIEDNEVLEKLYRVFDYNAHAWVEIYTDQFGWIPIDPTSDLLAKDEVLPFSNQFQEDETKFLESILQNLDKLRPLTKVLPEAKDNQFDIDNNDSEIRINWVRVLFIVSGIVLFVFLLIFLRFDIFYLLFNRFPYIRKYSAYLFHLLVKRMHYFCLKVKENPEPPITYEDMEKFIRFCFKNEYHWKKNGKPVIFKEKDRNKLRIKNLKEDYYKIQFSKDKKEKMSFASLKEFKRIYYYFLLRS